MALAGAVRTLCERRFALERVREREALPRVIEASEWLELGDAGVFSIRAPDDHGGLGLGMAESVVVFEELGRALVPGPIVATTLAAGIVDGATTGSSVVGSTHRPRRGMPVLVEHLDALDALVVVDEEGLAVVDPSSLDGVAASRSLDPLTPVWIVDAPLPEGDRIGGPEGAIGWRYGEALLTSAMSVGNAAATLEMSVAYAKAREQFGRPIGSFQAIKHICADMLVRVELARVAVHAAAVIADDPSVGDPIRSMSGATLLALDAALENGRKCIQVHGGVGFTWDVPAHLYLMRAKVLEAALGGVDMAETVTAHL